MIFLFSFVIYSRKRAVMNIITAFIFAFIGAVSAQITITSPNSDSVFVAGQDAVITWQTTTTATMDIELMRLIFGSFTKVITIGTNIDPASGSFTWSVPTTLTTPLDSDIYKVLFKSTDLAPNGYMMDGFFTIASPSNAPASSNPPSSSAAPPTSSPPPRSSSSSASPSPSSPSATTSGSSTAATASNPPGSPTGTSSHADETSTPGGGGGNDDGLGTGAIAGIAVGSVGGVGLIVLIGVLFCVYKRRGKKEQGGSNSGAESKDTGPTAEESYQTRSFVPPYVITTGQEHYHSAQYVPPSTGYKPDQQYYTDVPHSQTVEYRNDVPHSMDYVRQDVPHSAETEYPSQVPHSVNPEYYGRQHVPHTLETEPSRYDSPNYHG
ncbi:hypothetical protein BJV82DRAFT_658256 [Fennellomyces sp. T-0311]|nr:hypothetical protein BJV82DRAFT_658256 [Fennellomyces sp. T-0311]